MKTINKIHIVLLLTATLTLGACSESYLDREPIGSTLTETQYQQLSNKLEYALRGLYSMMYEYGDHDVFGQRSIDMYGDLLSGDMALTSQTYGWFYVDESEKTRTERSGYLWSYYYRMLHNTNNVIRSVEQATSLVDSVNIYGLPNDGLLVINADGDTLHTYTEVDGKTAYQYAQALTLRGYIYSGLIRFFTPTVAHIYNDGGGTINISNYPAFPMYDETNLDEVQPLAMLSDVYNLVETDLATAIAYYEAFDEAYSRPSKLRADINVARGIFAYYFLNRAYLSHQYDVTMPLAKGPLESALKYAKDLIETNEYQIIKNEKLYSTGFNNVDETSWIWGENVTTETSTGLGSFFGQVDIHSYSYAWSGDTKVIDQDLYEAIPSWDGRKYWFNDGSKNATFKLCPDGKFFSATAVGADFSTASDDIDREWLSDNIFMRIESIYLIAAEASYFLGNQNDAVDFLDAILSERLNPYNDDAASEYAAFKATLYDPSVFIQELYRNWRLEMWGEGYGLQTFRRLSYLYRDENTSHADKDKVYRGANHLFDAGKSIEYTEEIYTMSIPGSELLYNPYLQE